MSVKQFTFFVRRIRRLGQSLGNVVAVLLEIFLQVLLAHALQVQRAHEFAKRLHVVDQPPTARVLCQSKNIHYNSFRNVL